MYKIDLSITPEGMTQCDLITPHYEHSEAEEFFTFLHPYMRALHWLASEFQPDSHIAKVDDQEGQHE